MYKKEMYMNTYTDKLSTKIAAIIISLTVAVSMLTAAPVRAAENAAAQDSADAKTTEQTVDTQTQTEVKADAQTDASAEEQAQTVQTSTEQAAPAAEQAVQNEEQTASDSQAEETTATETTKSAAARSTSGQQKAASKKKSVEIEAPDEVDNVKATSVGRGKIVVTWTPVKDADGYYIYMAKKKNGKFRRIARVKGEKKRKYSYNYKKLSSNKRYHYKVYAYKKVNGETLMSESADRDHAKNTLSYKKKYTMKATAYSGGGLCANGKACKVGRVAVDPDVIPLGTWLYVKGYGFCQACDTGGAIQGKRIDLYYNSESRCNAYGVRYTKVYVLRK